jgi:hypothetical protein
MQKRIDSKIVVFDQVKPLLSKSYLLQKGQNLFYELFLNKDMQLQQNVDKGPKRGHSAFETDIIIFENKRNKIPRVVIECKKNLTSHDVITYNSKAGLHKDIYPWIRYGIIDIGVSRVPGKFYTHNSNIDFFIAADENFRKNDFQSIGKVLKKEIKLSKIKEKILFEKKSYKVFSTEIRVS